MYRGNAFVMHTDRSKYDTQRVGASNAGDESRLLSTGRLNLHHQILCSDQQLDSHCLAEVWNVPGILAEADRHGQRDCV